MDRGLVRFRAFTLTELMVAVLVLIVVIAATSKIFGTASKVTGIGQATSDVLQEASALERRIRKDFENLSREGYFAVRCVAVPNDLYAPGPLINPQLPSTAYIRSDQLMFFTHGVESIQTYRDGSFHDGHGIASRVYYGHAYQLPEGGAVNTAFAASDDYVQSHDPLIDAGNPLVPWSRRRTDTVLTVFRLGSTSYLPLDYHTTDNVPIDATQPPALDWLLARHAVVLVDDGGSDVLYLHNLTTGGVRTARSVNDDVVRQGRVDAAASELNVIRKVVLWADNGGVLYPRPWNNPSFPADDYEFRDQRNVVSNLLFYPRAERLTPSMHRVDQALTNHVLAAACSSFTVDWTYNDGVGRTVDRAGDTVHSGVRVKLDDEQPWFGLDPDNERGVKTFTDSQLMSDGDPIFYENIDNAELSEPGDAIEANSPGTIVYESFFGYNENSPFGSSGNPDPTVGYTPWPSAIRITMVLRDTAGRLEHGREIQFVVDLPRP